MRHQKFFKILFSIIVIIIGFSLIPKPSDKSAFALFFSFFQNIPRDFLKSCLGYILYSGGLTFLVWIFLSPSKMFKKDFDNTKKFIVFFIFFLSILVILLALTGLSLNDLNVVSVIIVSSTGVAKFFSFILDKFRKTK